MFSVYVTNLVLNSSLFPVMFGKNLINLLVVLGKYINGTTLVLDGGLWLSSPRHLSKEAVKNLSRAVEKRSRVAPIGLPKSKL